MRGRKMRTPPGSGLTTPHLGLVLLHKALAKSPASFWRSASPGIIPGCRMRHPLTMQRSAARFGTNSIESSTRFLRSHLRNSTCRCSSRRSGHSATVCSCQEREQNGSGESREFFRHGDLSARWDSGGSRRSARSPLLIGLDESQPGYSLAGWSPPEPASASSAGVSMPYRGSSR